MLQLGDWQERLRFYSVEHLYHMKRLGPCSGLGSAFKGPGAGFSYDFLRSKGIRYPAQSGFRPAVNKATLRSTQNNNIAAVLTCPRRDRQVRSRNPRGANVNASYEARDDHLL